MGHLEKMIKQGRVNMILKTQSKSVFLKTKYCKIKIPGNYFISSIGCRKIHGLINHNWAIDLDEKIEG